MSIVEEDGMQEIYNDMPKIFLMNKESMYYQPEKHRAFKESGVITVDKLENKGGKIRIPFVYDSHKNKYCNCTVYDHLIEHISVAFDKSIKEMSDNPGYMEEYGYLMMYDIFPILYRKILEVIKVRNDRYTDEKVRRLLMDIRYIRDIKLEPVKQILNDIVDEVDYCVDILSWYAADLLEMKAEK